nr:ubiquitin carboxyl-terminal hydrolase 19-like [Rhipicephalus microplus]
MEGKRLENKRRKEKENSGKEVDIAAEKKRALKHDWSQTRAEVSATLDVGFPLDSNQVTLECTDSQCSVTLPDGRQWQCELYAPVVAECTSLVQKSKKVVVKMVKQDPNIDWQQLEKVEGSPSLPSSDEELKDQHPTVELVGPKYDYYESGVNGDTVTVTLFVKSISKEAFAVDFDERGFLVKFHTKNTNTEFLEQHGASEETTFTWRVNVKEAIRPEECRFKLSPCKLELILKKKVPSRWSCLELAPPAKKIAPLPAPSNTWVPVSRNVQGRTPLSNVAPVHQLTNNVQGSVQHAGVLDSCAGDASTASASLSDPLLKKVINKPEPPPPPPAPPVPALPALASPALGSPVLAPPVVVARGYTGLDNLGNTCFMNAVLQCLANTREFRDYFLSATFQGELNRDNPLGMHGELAVAFAVLVSWLWSGKQRSFAPDRLKRLISIKASQFTGFAQHDAQEFMAFLLDGLHEDLNRIHNKPYVERVESNGRPDSVVADESWSNYKLRNDSIVVDLFQGQYKSTVICPKCHKVSISFDPFLYLTVPLPKRQRVFVVQFFALDPQSVPVKLRVRLNHDAKIQDLKEEIFKKTKVSPKNLRLLEVYNRRIYKVYGSEESLVGVNPKDQIFAFEVLDRDVARERVVELAVVQRALMPPLASTCSSCGKECVAEQDKLKRCTRCFRVGYCNRVCQTNHWQQHKSACKFYLELVGLPFVVSMPASQATYQNLCRLMEAHSRHSVNVFQPPVESSKRTLEAATAACTNEVAEVNNQEVEIHADSVSQGAGDSSGAMFTVTSVSSENTECKTDFVLEDEGNEPLDFSGVIRLAMDWKNDQRQGNYVLVESKEVEYAMSDDDRNMSIYEEDGITLDQCLRLFTEPEVLDPQEAWYCPGCREHRQATKEFSLWRLPVVLVIQLKRFSFTRSIFRDKIDKMVDFPVYGLDMSPYYCGPGTSHGQPPIYDLFAVTNHHGGMLGGHYTAFARCTNPVDTRLSEIGWRLFDDSHVADVSDTRVVTASAYMLFYRRRGVPFDLPAVVPRPLPSASRLVPVQSQKLVKDQENLLGQELASLKDSNNNRRVCDLSEDSDDDYMNSPD